MAKLVVCGCCESQYLTHGVMCAFDRIDVLEQTLREALQQLDKHMPLVSAELKSVLGESK